ncbi:MAG: zinc metalloprotease [Deltaproteobacteria bacterium]|nr:zinc metalloprotease [Deltaproteobacteria bacterium]
MRNFGWLALVLAGCGVASEGEPDAPFVFGGVTYEDQATWGQDLRRCGNELAEGEAEQIDRMLAERALLHADGPVHALLPPLQTGAVIDTYVHVLYSNNGNGNLSQAEVDDQIATLNAAYAGTGYSFNLVSTDWTANQAWAQMNIGGNDEAAAKAALRQGTADDLNLYTADLQGGFLGWATFPWNYAGNNTDDGVVILYDTVPGGAAFPYDEGDTAVHEVGHWLGLFHTFERGNAVNGCKKKGDRVADTPKERDAAYGCPVNRDTCAGDVGLDPVENFMDYTDDACMFEFSVNQDDRIDLNWTDYRYLQ